RQQTHGLRRLLRRHGERPDRILRLTDSCHERRSLLADAHLRRAKLKVLGSGPASGQRLALKGGDEAARGHAHLVGGLLPPFSCPRNGGASTLRAFLGLLLELVNSLASLSQCRIEAAGVTINSNDTALDFLSHASSPSRW